MCFEKPGLVPVMHEIDDNWCWPGEAKQHDESGFPEGCSMFSTFSKVCVAERRIQVRLG